MATMPSYGENPSNTFERLNFAAPGHVWLYFILASCSWEDESLFKMETMPVNGIKPKKILFVKTKKQDKPRTDYKAWMARDLPGLFKCWSYVDLRALYVIFELTSLFTWENIKSIFLELLRPDVLYLACVFYKPRAWKCIYVKINVWTLSFVSTCSDIIKWFLLWSP